MTPAVSEVNSVMWLFTALIIGALVVSTVLFVKLARSYDKKYNLLTKDETKSVVRSGAIACFGATFISVATISLIALVGPAFTYMRCGVIGAPMWEMMMAQAATTVIGIDFTDKAFTVNCLILCVFCMTLGSAPYFINCLLTLKPLDSLVQKANSSNKKVSFMPYLASRQ